MRRPAMQRATAAMLLTPALACDSSTAESVGLPTTAALAFVAPVTCVLHETGVAYGAVESPADAPPSLGALLVVRKGT